jgi:hypothetical protein
VSSTQSFSRLDSFSRRGSCSNPRFAEVIQAKGPQIDAFLTAGGIHADV